jgi:hypothetical protein
METTMKRITFLIIGMACIIFAIAIAANAQEAVEKAIDLRWQTEGAEPDVQFYQLYAGDSDTTLVKFGDPIPFNPNAPDAAEQLTADYTITVPAGQEVTKWFSVTAIDTSGNESDLATPVSVVIDNQPPGIPQGLTVTIRIIVQ